MSKYITREEYDEAKQNFAKIASEVHDSGSLTFDNMLLAIMYFVNKGIYERNDDVITDILTAADSNSNETFDFEEFLRIHIALKYGNVLV